MIRHRTIYKGHVQGVGFRATTRSIVRSFPVTGFVRNEPDGTVLCESQGEPGDLAAFHAEVRRQLARRISREDCREIPTVDSENSFEVRY